jgi:hypothetical protein
MKLFSEYLAESVRTYNYLIKLDFKPDETVLNKIEQSLGKYQLVDITAPKSKPITRVDKDFPGINSPEVYTITCSVSYPAPAEFIRHTIAAIGLELQDVVVVNADHEQSMETEDDLVAKNSDKPLIGTEEPKQDNKKISDDNFGTTYNEKLVKNSIGSTDQMIPSELKKTKGKTLNDIPVGNKSPMTHQNKLTPVQSFAR